MRLGKVFSFFRNSIWHVDRFLLDYVEYWDWYMVAVIIIFIIISVISKNTSYASLLFIFYGYVIK